MPTLAFVGIGSNLDNPVRQVTSALRRLASIESSRLVAQSRLFANRAIGPGQQPDYVNAVAALETELDAHDFLDSLQMIEQTQGRVRELRWGARTLDLDLLLFGEQIINSERLQIPHPELQNRDFVLYPLADINPHLILPNGKPIASLLALHPAEHLRPICNETGV